LAPSIRNSLLLQALQLSSIDADGSSETDDLYPAIRDPSP